MAAQQNISVQQADSRDESTILSRSPAGMKGDWEITRLPVQRRLTQSPVINLGSTTHNCSCVLGDTPILLADGSTRAIEEFVGGEQVRNLGGVGTVIGVTKVKLGYTRRIIEMIGNHGQSLFVSDEHPLWTRFEEDGKVQEWWGVYNYSHYYMERCAQGYDTVDTHQPRMLRFDIPNTHATIDGWRHVQPVFHMMSPETPIYDLEVDVGSSYFANGFLIRGNPTATDSEGAHWNAEVADEQAQRFIRSLTASV
ncbi:hypothetical protein BWP39_29145 [Paraburkholderia acidicola]|uniref:Hint domain-containing protein n=1 Tax=Paraburkholderia acidicola TaxID=1912599 RepID=A0A2A4ETM3_9BURK|nr:hypothetical protein [Paraburkholderia acidicola]PCE23748.1 hypothetical protein BWP39_29145 [Paraburkholderia acidicola]